MDSSTSANWFLFPSQEQTPPPHTNHPNTLVPVDQLSLDSTTTTATTTIATAASMTSTAISAKAPSSSPSSPASEPVDDAIQLQSEQHTPDYLSFEDRQATLVPSSPSISLLRSSSSSSSFASTPASTITPPYPSPLPTADDHLNRDPTLLPKRSPQSASEATSRQPFPQRTDQSDQHHPQRPGLPHRLRSSVTPSAPTRKRSICRSQLLTEIPSSAECHSSAGPSSASPSSWSIASSDTAPSSATSMIESKIRFEKLPNGSHRHHLSAPKRQQFLSNQVRRLRELLDGKRDHSMKEDHGVGAMPHPPPHQPSGSSPSSGRPHQLKPEVLEHPLSLLNEKYHDLDTDQIVSLHTSVRRRSSVKEDFVQKYGELQQVVGKGAFGTVRLSIKRNQETGEEHVYAVKEFKYTHGESLKLYMRRLTSEFCIASSLKHTNVIKTMDLLQIHGDTYSEVMEYCAGGDMHSLIASANTLGEAESNCFFSQLVYGVAFLHSMGVVHRDLKPENLLLTSDGCIKIADFGNSEVFRMPWEKKVRSSASIRGTGPFIAPEEFTNKTFDARKVDMWACGIIYMCMRLGRYTWHEASDGDPVWGGFLYKRERLLESHNLDPTEHVPPHINLTALEQASHISLSWPTHIANVVENLLEPDTRKRWQATHVLDSEWFKQIDNCHPTARPPDQKLDESDFEPAAPSQRVGSKVIAEDASVTGCKIVKEVRVGRVIIDNHRVDSAVSPAS